MNVLPLNWMACQLGDVVDYGKTRKCEPEDIPGDSWVLELEDIEKGSSRLLERKTFAQRQSKSTKNSFDTGDVLYGKLRPYLNKVLIADRPGYCTTEIVPLKAGPHLDGRYLFYWLKHPTFLAYVEAESHGLNMPRLGTDTGRAAPFVFAPRPEQTRIADKLDAVLARVDACRDRLDRVPVILKRFRQSVLAAATSGSLTEDWRASTALDGWSTAPLADLCHSVSDGDHQAPPQSDSGIPFITISAINDGKLRLEKATRFVPLSYFEALKSGRQPVRGDVLFSVTGSIGIPALVDVDHPFTFQRHIAILKPNRAKITSEYLVIALGTEDVRQQALAIATGTAQLTIPLNGLRSIAIPMPPLGEQAEIVRRVENLFAFADRLEARYTAAHAQIEKLTPSLLAKAFRGKLVPQDPNDEPASALLERIRKKRATQTIQKNSTRASKDKTMKASPPPANLADIVNQMVEDSFTFEQLSSKAARDYETLKSELFALLADTGSGLTQVFDTKSQTIKFMRTRK